MKLPPPTHYSDYLKVPELTQLQFPRSEKFGQTAHDEMLFIITHQAYELWFKQILFELDSIINLLNRERVEDRNMLTINSRLKRIMEIQNLLILQINVLETMTPMDFLEFRDYLYPASGFQSGQFRLIENKMGLSQKQRLTYNNQDYKKSLTPEDQQQNQLSENQPSLFELFEKWLERTPFLSQGDFDFWKEYYKAVQKQMTETEQNIENSDNDVKIKEQLTKSMKSTQKSFQSIFDEKLYNEMKQQGHWRLSHKALRSALFIYLYRHEPILQFPFQFMENLQSLDEGFTQWRNRHAQMVHRMIGVKMGTGGSVGHKYLKASSDRHKVFDDLNNLASFFISKTQLPILPEEVLNKLRFH